MPGMSYRLYMRKQEIRAEGPYADSGYTDQIGFYTYALTSNKYRPVLQIECKCLTQEEQNHIQEQSREQNGPEVKCFLPVFPGASLSDPQVQHIAFFWPCFHKLDQKHT